MIPRRLQGRVTEEWKYLQQDRFRTAIYGFNEMCLAGTKLVKAAGILRIPVYATEQNPKIGHILTYLYF